MQRRWLDTLLVTCVLLAAPAALRAQQLELVGSIPGPATTVHVHGTHAYVSEGPTLRLFDIADPAAPALLGAFTFPQNVYGVSSSGSIVYAAVDFYGLGIVDVSDPAAPVQIGHFQTPGQALSVAHSGSTVVVTNRLSGLEVIDVSNPSAPVSQGSYFTEGYAIDVDASGSYAYVVDTPGGLSVVDLSKSGELAAEGSQSVREPSAAVSVTTLRSSDGRDTTLAGLMSASSQLEIFDVSNPTAPVSIGNYRDPGRPTTTYAGAAAAVGFVRVFMQGSTAFLTDTYPPFQLQVVDVSDPRNPALVTSYEPPGSPQDIAVAGPLVLVALRTGDSDAPGVVILRLRR